MKTSEKAAPSLRERNKQRVRRQIIDAAVTLVADQGLEAVTADHIAVEAEVGRATFFRYFDSKEAAVVVGFYEERLNAMVETLAKAPATLGALDAVIWTFAELGKTNADQHGRLIRLGSKLQALSPALKAKAAEYHSRYEQAIADAVASRCQQGPGYEMQPRMIAASVLAVTHVVVEHWSANRDAGEFPLLVRAALEQLKTGFSPTKTSSKTPSKSSSRRAA